MSRYYMKSKNMYVTSIDFSTKEHTSMNQELSQTFARNVRIQEIKVSSGRNEAIKFNEFDGTDSIVMSELKTLGYERESVTDPFGSHPVWDDSECCDIDE